MSNKDLKFGITNKVALFRNNKIVKLFISQMECAKYYKISEPDLSKFLSKKIDINFLQKNETLKVISETTAIKYEIVLFKKHLHYLKKNNLLNFKCDVCLKISKETLPMKTYQTVGVCNNCKKIKEVSSGALNKWLTNKKYNLQISDRSRFLKSLMPFELVSTSLPDTEQKDDRVIEIQNLTPYAKTTEVNSNLDTKVDKVNTERLINAYESTKPANQPGTNTGDKNLSPYTYRFILITLFIIVISGFFAIKFFK